MTKKYLKIGILIISYGLLVIGFSSSVFAQAKPEFMVTWKANNYVPSNYQGRTLPIDGTIVNVNFEIIDSGKFADLSKTEVFWHINNVFQKSGLGVKNSTFTADRTKGEQLVEIIIPNYRFKTETIRLEKSLVIPLFKPETIIDAPYPNNKISAGAINFRALLYFFNITNPISDVSYVWSTNGQKAAGETTNPSLITLDTAKLPSGTDFNLVLKTQSLLNDIELSKQLINLKIK